MIILNGIKYRLTLRGQIIVGILLVLLVVGMVQLTGTKRAVKESVPAKTPGVVAVSKNTATSSSTHNKAAEVKSLKVPEAFSIFFGPDSTTLNTQFSALDQLATFVKSTPNAYVVIGGNYNAFPDLRGSYFESLSLARAVNVAGYLRLHDVPEERIEIINYGGKKQLNKGSSKSELAKNRRVDVMVRIKK